MMARIGIIDTSLNTQEKERDGVSTLKQLREEAGLTAFKLAAEAEVSLSTINRMEYGHAPVTKRIANQVLAVLSQHLGRRITLQDVEGLEIVKPATK